MRRDAAVGIEPLHFRAETDGGDAEFQHFALLLRRQLAANPDEFLALVGKLGIKRLAIEIRKKGRDFLHRLIEIDDAERFGKHRNGVDVCRQKLAIAIGNVRTRRDIVIGGNGCGRLCRAEAVFGHPGKHRAIGKDETGRQDDEAGSRLLRTARRLPLCFG
ncbi:hypothetical protein D3C87_1638300 [compost metagenome]